MEVKTTEHGMLALLSGDIDHHSAAYMRAQIDAQLLQSRPQCLILDFSGVTFMDSSGIGLIMGRYRSVSQWGGRVIVRDPSPQLKRVMKLAGIQKIAAIETTDKGVQQKHETVQSNETDRSQQIGQ